MPLQIVVGVTMQIQSVSGLPISTSVASANESIKKQRQDPSRILLSSSSDARARAEGKIEDAKAEIEFLKRYGFPPEVIARLAGELARSVGTAAQEFSQAVGTAATSSVAPNSAVVDGATALAQASTTASKDAEPKMAKDASPTNDSNTGGPDSVDAKQAMLAYHAVAKDGGASSNLSSGDQRIVDQFNAVLAEIKALLDKAKRDMQAEKHPDVQLASAAPGADITGQQTNIPALSALFV